MKYENSVHMAAAAAGIANQVPFLPHHPACELLPVMSKSELDDLTNDICAIGLQNDLITYNGQILDGRCRQLACHQAGVKPRLREWDGQGSPTAFVIAQNLHRRHLGRDQMTAIAVESLAHFEAEAEQRLHLSQGRGKKVAPNGATFRGKASEAAAEVFRVSARQIERAKSVKNNAPTKFDAIKRGELTITDALAEIANTKKTDALKAIRASWTPKESSRLDERRLIRRGDAFELLESPPWPFNHVVTDPPYSKDDLCLFEPLAEKVAKTLPPDGMFVCMVGQLWMPEIIAAITKHLQYRWTICYLMPIGGRPTVRAHADANPLWRPVLVFGSKESGWINKDIVQSESIDPFWKSKHPYAQCPTGFERLLEVLQIRPGQVIADPFMGTAATGAAALRRLCRFVGVDVEQKHVESAELRLTQEWNRLKGVREQEAA